MSVWKYVKPGFEIYFNSLGRILTIRATLLEKNAKISTVLIKKNNFTFCADKKERRGAEK